MQTKKRTNIKIIFGNYRRGTKPLFSLFHMFIMNLKLKKKTVEDV